MRRLSFVLAAVLGGCFQPEPGAGAPCAEGGRCPSGLTCVAGTCLEPDDPLALCVDQPDGTPCGSATASECNAADSCLGGVCVTNEAQSGACYDCAAGAGLCLACAAGACTDAACTLAAGAPTPAEVISGFVANNGDEGNMFDIVATTTITITSFETHSTTAGTTDYEIWTKAGTHVGAEMDATQWTRIGTATFALSGAGTFSPIPIPVNVTVAAGQRQAFYLTNKTLNNRYHNGTAVGAVLAQTPELTLYEGSGNNYATAGFGTINTPRAWEGKIHYRSGGGKTLATTFAGTVAASGVMFDVAAKTGLEATLLAAHLAPGTHDVDIYFKRGTYAGAETQAMAWQRAASLQGVVSAGTNMPTSLPLASPVFIDAGSTTAFYITTSAELRTAAGTAGANAANNADVTIKTGVAITGVFGGAGAGANPNVELGYGLCN